MNTNTAIAHVEWIVAERDGAPFTESPFGQELVMRDAPPLREAVDQRVGVVVLVLGLVMLALGALVS